MSDLVATFLVTRDNLETPLADLDINDHVDFIVARGFRAGQVTWRHNQVTSPYVHGHFTVNSAKEPSPVSLTVFALGEDMADLESNISTLLTAFNQAEYTLSTTIEGRTFEWTCERADYEVGLIPENIIALKVPVGLSFNRHPVPTVGVV